LEKDGKQWGSTSDNYTLQKGYESLEMEVLYGTVKGFSISTYLANKMYGYLNESCEIGRTCKYFSIYENFLFAMARNKQKLYSPQLLFSFPLEDATSNTQ
jgi:hypothetical protein